MEDACEGGVETRAMRTRWEDLGGGVRGAESETRATTREARRRAKGDGARRRGAIERARAGVKRVRCVFGVDRSRVRRMEKLARDGDDDGRDD